jgi:hypothetical protein
MYAITREVFLDPDVQSGEFLRRMTHTEKCFFMENAIRTALHTLIVQGGMVSNHRNQSSTMVASIPAPAPRPQPVVPPRPVALKPQYTSSVASAWGSEVSKPPESSVVSKPSEVASSRNPSSVAPPPSLVSRVESAARIDTSTVNLLNRGESTASVKPARGSSTTFDVMNTPRPSPQQNLPLPDPPSTTTKQLSVDSQDLPPSLTEYGDEARNVLDRIPAGSVVVPEDSASNMVAQK